MAISPATITRSSVLAGMSNTQRGGTAYCATCGRAAQITQGAFSGSYSGRASGDSYFCATCNQSFAGNVNQSRTTNQTNTYGRATNNNGTTYGTCSTCNQATSSVSHWSGNSYGLSWVR